MRGVHRQFAITFAAAPIRAAVTSPSSVAITAADGGLTYDRREKGGTAQGLPGLVGPEFVHTDANGRTHRGQSDIRLPMSIGTFTTRGVANTQLARIAGDNEALLGVLANLESDYSCTIESSGVYWCAIGNETSGTAQTPAIGQGVLGALGSAHGVADGDVTTTTQTRGFVRSVERGTIDANALNRLAHSARTMCLELINDTGNNARHEARNGIARILFL